MTGVAVNVTDAPAQIVVADAVIVTLGTTVGVTIINTGLEDMDGGDEHVAFDVKTQVITSLLFKVADVNVVELVPEFTPFTCH